MPGTHHLFTVTRLLLRIATGFCFFLIAVLALALGALELMALGLFHLPADAMSDIQSVGLNMGQVITAVGIGITGCAICVALAAWMFVLTTRIIDTAGAGDPFVGENADRLNHIAWLLLASQVVGFVFDTVLNTFPDKIKDHVNFGFDVSATGILAALLIFILAQIFRRGSEMRAELEGTV